jgi:hypothetical protein
MLYVIEFLLYLFFAIIWYQTARFVANKKISKVVIDNDAIIKYNNVLNEYYYNECFYKRDYSYESLWTNNNKNGFDVVHGNNITISGYKKDNVYDGLVRIDGTLLENNDLKGIDCIYENGVQKSCFVINKKNRIVFIVPEQVAVVL